MFNFSGYLPLFSIVGENKMEVPTQLEVAAGADQWILGFVLFLSFLMLALAKRLDPFILNVTLRSVFTLDTPDNLQKFDARYNSTSFVLLGFLSFFSLWVCMVLYNNQTHLFEHIASSISGVKLSSNNGLILSLVATGIIVLYLFLGLLFTSFISGEKNMFSVFITQSWVNFIYFGILFFVLALLWLLNSPINPYISQLFLIVLLGLFVLRMLKILIVALLNGVSWYYLILYLCTLEVLPIFAVFALMA
jgi:hypothetical protein